jgi:hypothetical protein
LDAFTVAFKKRKMPRIIQDKLTIPRLKEGRYILRHIPIGSFGEPGVQGKNQFPRIKGKGAGGIFKERRNVGGVIVEYGHNGPPGLEYVEIFRPGYLRIETLGEKPVLLFESPKNRKGRSLIPRLTAEGRKIPGNHRLIPAVLGPGLDKIH